jgi:flagellar motor component MotA
MMLEGVISILEGINPRMLEVKLGGFVDATKATKTEVAEQAA